MKRTLCMALLLLMSVALPFSHALTLETHELEYFSYQLPDDWVKKPVDNGGFYHYGAKHGSIAGGYVYTKEDEMKTSFEDDSDLYQYFGVVLDGMLSGIWGDNDHTDSILYSEKIQINGRKALHSSIYFDNSKIPVSVFFVEYGKHFISLSFTDSNLSKESIKSKGLEIANTIKVKNLETAVVTEMPGTQKKTMEQAINGYEAILAYVNRAADFGVKIGEYDSVFVIAFEGISTVSYANAGFYLDSNNDVFYASYTMDNDDPNDIFLLLAFVHAFDSYPAFDSVSATIGQDPKSTWMETYTKVMAATKEKPYVVGTYDEYAVYVATREALEANEKDYEAVSVLYIGK